MRLLLIQLQHIKEKNQIYIYIPIYVQITTPNQGKSLKLDKLSETSELGKGDRVSRKGKHSLFN